MTVNQEVIQVILEAALADQRVMKVNQEVMTVGHKAATVNHEAMQAILTADHIANHIADNSILNKFSIEIINMDRYYHVNEIVNGYLILKVIGEKSDRSHVVL